MNEAGRVLIRLDGVEKSYPTAITGSERLATLWSLLRGRRDFPCFKALSGINLEVRAGESLGIIGSNGAGKSTLLKVVAGVVRPNAGRVIINGRISALLELGAGFHPEYTGRENVALASALMGLDRDDLAHRLDDILAFADIGSHIDQPLKHYSSGMVVRLGFAIATALRPDILVTDEVLAVGDESFQRKCITWLENYLSGGGTLLLCSHSLYYIKTLCSHALWLRDGTCAAYGDAFDVSQEYLAYHERISGSTAAGPAPAASDYAVRDLQLLGVDGKAIETTEQGQSIFLHGRVRSPDGRTPHVVVGIMRIDGTPVYSTSTNLDGIRLVADADGLFGFSLTFEDLPLLPGSYAIRAHALDPEGIRMFGAEEVPLQVKGRSREYGLVHLRHCWRDSSGRAAN